MIIVVFVLLNSVVLTAIYITIYFSLYIYIYIYKIKLYIDIYMKKLFGNTLVYNCCNSGNIPKQFFGVLPDYMARFTQKYDLHVILFM